MSAQAMQWPIYIHTIHTRMYVATYMQMQLNTRHYPSPLGLYASTRRGGLQLLWHLHFLWHFRYAIQRRVRTSDWRQPGGCRWCCYLGNKQKRSDWDGECKCAPRMKALWLTFRPLIKPSKLPTERERESFVRMKVEGTCRQLGNQSKHHPKPLLWLFCSMTEMHFL